MSHKLSLLSPLAALFALLIFAAPSARADELGSWLDVPIEYPLGTGGDLQFALGPSARPEARVRFHVWSFATDRIEAVSFVLSAPPFRYPAARLFTVPPGAGLLEAVVYDDEFEAVGTVSQITFFTLPSASDCLADLDDDEWVGTGDLIRMLAVWGMSGEGDLDGNGEVGLADLFVLLTCWGDCACPDEESDADGDGVPDCHDLCPGDARKILPGQCGCGRPESLDCSAGPCAGDFDRSGVVDVSDLLVLTSAWGRSDPASDLNQDGRVDLSDLLILVGSWGVCGCEDPDRDTDGDGVPDCDDGCPYDGGKIEPLTCGCNRPDTPGCVAAGNECVADFNGDGVVDVADFLVIIASWGQEDPSHDLDGSGVIDVGDLVALLGQWGFCGCSSGALDRDGDGVRDCDDECPLDPLKILPGACGCGTADLDSDGDGELDCDDGCPYDPDKTAPGDCGCGRPEVPGCPPLPGWTDLQPSADTRKVYVSSSEGHDANDGLSPDRAVCTLLRGMEELRSGRPDWLLLKRGDVWTNEVLGHWTKSGRSPEEPMVISAYGDAPARPKIFTGDRTFYWTSGGGQSPPSVDYVAMVGLHFEAHTHDGISYHPHGISVSQATNHMLIEDNYIGRFDKNIMLNGNEHWRVENIIIRRNVIVDAFTVGAVSVGMYAKSVHNVTLEENIFDHNGWNEHIPGTGRHALNHNLYFSQSVHADTTDIVVQDNIFSAGSSHGMKGTFARVVENNLWTRNAIGFFTNRVPASIRKNVVLDGRDISPDVPRGKGIEVLEIGGGHTIVEENIVANKSVEFGNRTAFMIYPIEPTEQLTLRDNIVWNWHGQGVDAGSDTGSRMFAPARVVDNTIIIFEPEFEDLEMIRFMDADPIPPDMFSGNAYYDGRDDDRWFRKISRVTFDEWLDLSDETDAVELTRDQAENRFVDPHRTIANYHGSLGREATHEAFIAEARKQSRRTWREEYSAAAVNDYIRSGFERR